MVNRRSGQAVLWTAIITVFGLVVRRAPLHLPLFVSKYGGSILWGAMVYAIFVAIAPNRRPVEIGVAASLFAIAVELFKLVHMPALDNFRVTLAGQLLIGRVFSYADIFAYWLAIAVFAAVDNATLSRANRISA
jgi:hypothetical protein